ncbi:hypothetical protein HYN48_13585 [Flavobacterium magnum]|uniref:Uncharacterized protein n=1 Tax=Flavobacterium magnum TaxID=2162713 RepID=A0A2S0RID9_9FLAO|nr:hypothetical protein [Flavobacterium magnum]AWA31030.1 hypothetical protein HYN48_13585 [Flavobacterium magnum]
MDDFQKILDVNLPFVKQLLNRNGEFYPLAAAINLDGEVEQILLEEDEDFDMPTSVTVIGELKKELRWRKLQLNAIAIFYDVKAGGKDAIAVDVEHKIEKQYLTFYYQYKLDDQGIEILESWKSLKSVEIFD